MVVFLAGGSQGFHGPSMEGIQGGDDLEFFGADGIPVFPGQFDGSFIGFCTTVGKEHPVESGDFAQLLGRFGLDFVVEQVGSVHDLGSLFADGLDQGRIIIPQGIHRNTVQEIDVFLSVRIV